MTEPAAEPPNPDAAPSVRKGATTRIVGGQLTVARLMSDEGQPFTMYCDGPPVVGS